MDDPARAGAKQPKRFDPSRAARLDDPARFAYLAPAELIELLDPLPGTTLLDFGTGTGTYAIAIARLRPDLRIIALDEQPEMLARLREKLAATGPANVELADPVSRPALRGRADRILALNVFHELGDAALANVGELLSTDGRMLVVDWNADIERSVGPPRDHVYGTAEARERLRDQGFTVEALRLFPNHYAMTVRRTAAANI